MSWGRLGAAVADAAIEPPQRRDLAQVIGQRIAWQETGLGPSGSMAIPAVFASVRLIAATIDQLQLTAPGDPVWLRDPRRYGCIFDQGDLVQYIVSSMATRGAASLWARPNDSGTSWQLAPVDPESVTVQRTVASDGRLGLVHRLAGADIDPVPPYREWRDAGRTRNNWSGRTFLLHIPYLVTVDEPQGISPIQAARETLRGYGMVERQAADLLDSGTWSGGVLETDADLPRQTAEDYQARWVENRKLGRIPVLGSGLKYSNQVLSPKDAMWLESRQFNASQVAQMFGIPPDYLGMAMSGGSSSLSYNNSADNDRRFRRNCLEGFTSQISDAFSTLLKGQQDRADFDWSAWEQAAGTITGEDDGGDTDTEA